MVCIRTIGLENAQDVRLSNEPFAVWGRMIPSLCEGRWSYRTEIFEIAQEMCFPDEAYDAAEDGAIFIGAYEGKACVGLAVLRKDRFRYLYLDDLKVCREYRRKGIGGMLVKACFKKAEELGFHGVSVTCQDNNLSAALFYIKQGFEIGGFDNRGYRGTSQENKADIYFYKDI